MVPPFQAILCDNFMCTKHSEELESYHDKLINACIFASLHLVQKRSSKKRQIIPGWSDMVKDLKEQALFWHTLWKTNGRPTVGLIADIRRST